MGIELTRVFLNVLCQFSLKFHFGSSDDPHNCFLGFYVCLVLCNVSCGFVPLPEAAFLPDSTHDINVHPQGFIIRSSDLGWSAIVHGFLQFFNTIHALFAPTSENSEAQFMDMHCLSLEKSALAKSGTISVEGSLLGFVITLARRIECWLLPSFPTSSTD